MNDAGKFYFISEEPKPNRPAEMRRIEKPKLVLKDYQRKLYRFLRNRIDFPECVHGSVKTRSYITNARRHIVGRYFFLVDIRKFFPSIHTRQVFEALRMVAIEPVATVLARLLTLDGHLATGSPASPLIANIVLRDVDRDIMKLCSENGLIYSRYVDDMTVSSRRDFSYTDLPEAILTRVHKAGFMHKANKTTFKMGSAIVTGVLVKRCRLRVPENARLKLMSVKYDEQWRPTYLGRLRYIKMIGEANRRRHATL